MYCRLSFLNHLTLSFDVEGIQIQFWFEVSLTFYSAELLLLSFFLICWDIRSCPEFNKLLFTNSHLVTEPFLH